MEEHTGGESTDLLLFVDSTTQAERTPWDPSKIIDSLMKEADMTRGSAESVAASVERQLKALKQQTPPSSLIRELIDLELIERGEDKAYRKHHPITIPIDDIRRILQDAAKENSNQHHNPESVNLSFAEMIQKQYAAREVFDRDVMDAHSVGDIHLHDLGFCIRPYCSGNSPVYVAKYGLDLPHIATTARPAKHPDVFISHLLKMSSILQSHFAGAIGWDAINVFMGPYLEGKSKREVYQLAEMMIFEFNQLAGARGSLRGDQQIIVYDKEADRVETLEIGQFVEQFLDDKEGSSAAIEGDRYRAVSFDKVTCEVRFSRVHSVFRHRNKHRTVELKTEDGQEVVVTDNHSLFQFNRKGRVLPALPRDHPQSILVISSFGRMNPPGDAFDINREIKRCPVSSNVTSIETVQGGEFVYDIGVEKDENFLTGDGIFAHNSQLVFSDLNFYTSPRHFSKTEAVLPGGVTDGRTYGDFRKESQDFLEAMFEVYTKGDSVGKTFTFPKPLLHINHETFSDPAQERLLDLACEAASKQGITYFVFDRGEGVTVSQCCRLSIKLDDNNLDRLKRPETMRFCALQNVTINLPRLAYKANGEDETLFEEIDRSLGLVARAHLNKKKFIKELLDLGDGGPQAFLAQALDGDPYLRLEEASYLVGLMGLNECVQYHTGREMHESTEAYKFGLKIVTYMYRATETLSKQFGLKFLMEETPGESAIGRLARLDLKYYPDEAESVVKGGEYMNGEHYTNSVHFAYDAPMDFLDRIDKQSRFHPFVTAGSIIHVWVGESEPSAASIKKLVKKTYEKTNATQICISPEFTCCRDCKDTSRGLNESCLTCGSENIYGLTRIVGYFSEISSWNMSKISELHYRKHENLEGDQERPNSPPL